MNTFRALKTRRPVHDWGPSSSVECLRRRAALIARVRDYFTEQGALEVTTPILSRYATSEPALCNLALEPSGVGSRFYLRTSPESAMKRLLATGSGDIYQLGPVFRGDEAGRLHLPEFTMLEWYRLDFDHHALMDDVEALIRRAGFIRPITRITYRALWERHVGENPHVLTTARLADIVRDIGVNVTARDATDRAALFDYVYVQRLEPGLASEGAVFVYDFPRELRAYARLATHDTRIAERFELVIDGCEIANGYHEIWDVDEQRLCFEQDNALRARRGLPMIVVDSAWLDALAHGFPVCAGAALGIERLFMALEGIDSIAKATSFAEDLV